MNSSLYGRVPVDTSQQRRNVTAAERFEYYQNVFRAVVKEYVRLKALSPVVASVVDPDSIGQSDRLTYDSINYAVDIESSTTKALENRLDLQATWFALASGEPTDPKLTRETIMRCGRIYTARKIAPWHYHVPNRYAHRRPR